jgi:hypothetical protein
MAETTPGAAGGASVTHDHPDASRGVGAFTHARRGGPPGTAGVLVGQAGVPHDDALAAHRHALLLEQRALPRALRHASVGPDDPMPRKISIVRGGKNMPDETRRAGVDVAIGADKPGGNRTHPVDDASCPWREALRAWLTGRHGLTDDGESRASRDGTIHGCLPTGWS